MDDLDMIYLGTYDMSVDLGVPGQMNDPKITEFVETSVKRIRQAGKAVGVMVHNQEDMKHMIDHLPFKK